MLICDFGDYDGDGWFWKNPHEHTLNTKQSRKCCSCGERVQVGETVVAFNRYRAPLSDIEVNIHGDEVPLADWHMCEICGDLFWNLDALGFCVIIGDDSMRELTRQYAETYGKPTAPQETDT